ncbi:MAG: DNA-directed RNA polymerase subunit beta' [Candidatus Babeliales bacterium]|nr:DNA-directed RNA polymerase subunit beta' [Candidatus Babeliales bacterium]
MTNQMLGRFKEYVRSTQFNAIRIGLASPEKIRSLSYGEVKKIETINYRTLKPERDGLFCARIFGPVKDWECNCGKYKRMKHRGVTCEKCGVEVIQSRVRRERMGHIDLVAPVCHIWYLKGIPSYLSLTLDMSVKDLEKVIYFDSYIVVHQGKSPYPRKTILTNAEFDSYIDSHTDDLDFLAKSGAEAIRDILKLIDLNLEVSILNQDYKKSTSVTSRHKIMRKIKVLTSFINANTRPELMVMEILPVLPPDLRPLVPLEGGRFASSDLNELYRRVLNRNIRLRRLKEIEAPEVIIKNEKRMLQESVDALIDNGRRGQPVRGTNRRPLKSLSEMLRGKQGRFRQNLLGKRVDYSGRSVIVVDPELKMDTCGLPKILALELYKPFVFAELIKSELAPNLRMAKKMVERFEPEIWDILENIVKDRPVLLNRAPTLHRLGIQSFYPILVDGKAIKIHPLVCSAFNADFDGDQMAVHIPLSRKAVLESKELILSTKNLLSPSNGRPLPVPSQEMVLGLHYLTKSRCNLRGEGIVFANVAEVISAHQTRSVDLHAQIKVRINTKIIDTTVGRVILYEALPKGADFNWVNRAMRKSDLSKLVETVYYNFDIKLVVECLDKIKKLGFKHATDGGISFSISDLLVPEKKAFVIDKAENDVQKIEKLYMDGAITNGERYNKVIAIWGQATADVAKEMLKDLELQNKVAYENKDGANQSFNSLFMMLESGARGSKDQVKQLVGMRGLMAKPSGEIMETPVKSNFKDGLSVFEYFVSTHGARKGQADTALKTANSGYLTRRLVDVAQDVVVALIDCKTLGYIELEDIKESGELIYSVANRSFGRVLAADVKDVVTGEILFKQGALMDKKAVEKLSNAAVDSILVRSGLTCQSKRGICAKCYGMDLSKGALVDIGGTVGIIAAQSIGEPGTQLTMRTFHIGGTASIAEQYVFVAKHNGIIQWSNVRVAKDRDGKQVVLSRKARINIVSPDGLILQEQPLEYGAVLLVEDGAQVKVGTKIADLDANNKVLVTEKTGFVKFVDLIRNMTYQEVYDETASVTNRIILEHKGEKHQPAISIVDEDGNELALYYLPTSSYLTVEQNQKVEMGDILVKMPREASKSKDITGGLPRIAEIFEARAPKDPAIITDIDGEVLIGGLHRGLRKVTVSAGDQTYDYFVSRGKQLNVVSGDKVSAGDLLTSGEPVLHDILRILGPDHLQKYLVNQIQQIYRLHGVDINDRHIEIIVKQMMKKVRISDPGDSEFLIGDKIDHIKFKMVNSLLQAEGKKMAVGKAVLMGITMASLDTESVFSAASFQETTRILAEAACSGQVDYLYGLKENVIIGKLIPAGSGIKSFKDKYIGQDLSEFERQALLEEQVEA